MSDTHIDIEDFIQDTFNDPKWKEEHKWPRIYQNVKKGDPVLKIQDFLGKEIYLLVDVDVSSDPIVADIQKLTMGSFRRLFTAKTMDPPYSKKQGENYYEKKRKKDENRRNVVPLSELLKDKRGECVEVSTVTQLHLQERGDEVYLVSGHLYEESTGGEVGHSWNILKKDDGYYLIDALNDFKSKILSVIHIENTGRYVLDTEKKDGSWYFLD